MNENKMDFIAAFNNERFFEECRFYVEQLNFPQNFEVGMLGITQGKSMTSAYNEGMQASDAKYKVYLHQDVFILNKNFIYDILEIFRSDSSVGMIGVIGGAGLPEDAVYCDEWNIGRVKSDNATNRIELELSQHAKYMDADAIDGMIMITQYDIPWRDDLFQGWDYYDISQSFEFRKRGYRIVVPYQKEAWCLHDCGMSKLQNYDQVRKVFCKEYIKNFRDEDFKERPLADPVQAGRLEIIRDKLVWLFDQREMAMISDVLRELSALDLRQTELRIMKNVFEIYDMEMEDEARDYVMFTDCFRTWQQIYEFYIEVKFLLRRIEQGYTGEEHVGALISMVREKKLSQWALLVISKRAVFEWEKVMTFLVSQVPELCEEKYAEKGRTMNIAISLNDGYTKYACVLLTSVLKHHRNLTVCVYALHQIGGLEPSNKEKLKSVMEEGKGEIFFLEVDAAPFNEHFFITEMWSVESYLRLALPDVLPANVERILYLDIDMIVNDNLEELYYMDIGENCIAACKDMGSGIPFNDIRDDIFKEHLTKEGFVYFCAGMMLWNVTEIKKRVNLEKFWQVSEQLENKLLAPDQDLLNYIFWDKVIAVDAIRYNAFSYCMKWSGVDYQRIKQTSAIVHFSGPKPWSSKQGKGFYSIERLWWEYARLTPYYIDFVEDLGEEGELLLRHLLGYDPQAVAGQQKIKESVAD